MAVSRERNHSHYSGQALLELAIFGSILLFCFGILIQYGLSLNYRQALQMVTFRRAVDLSYRRSSRGVSDTNVNLVVIHDKSIPDPSDPYRIKSYSPYIHQANAVYSDKMYRSPVDTGNDDEQSLLPGVDYIIDVGNKKCEGVGCKEWTGEKHLSSSTTLTDEKGYLKEGYLKEGEEYKKYSGYDEPRVGYFTTGWGWVECCKEWKCNRYKQEDGNDTTDCAEWECAPENKNKFRRKKNNPNGPIFWEWEDKINNKDITCDEVSAGMDLDVDNDFVEESVVKVNKEEAQFDSGGVQTRAGRIVSLTVLDPTQGDINNFYGEPDDQNKTVKPYIVDGKEKNQGLQSSYTKRIFTPEGKDNRIVRQEGDIEINVNGQTQKGILNAGIINNQETITRTVTLNKLKAGAELSQEEWEAGSIPPDKLEKKEIKSEFEQKEGRKYFTEF